MRAVNLIPADEARAARSGGRSGGGAYIVLAVLALAVIMVGTSTFLGRTAHQKQAAAAEVQTQAAAAEAKTASLKSFTDFTELRQKRTETVRQLAGSRFDWPHALRDVARTIPARAWVTSLRATVAPTVSVDGTADPLRQALPVPAIEVTGCARTQADVAGTVAAMRQVDGVQRVSLSSSAADSAGGDGDAGACAGPKFSMTVFFDAPTGQSTVAPGAATATKTGATP